MKTKNLTLFLYFMALSLGIASQTMAKEQKISQEAWKVKKELENEERRVAEEWKEQEVLLKKGWNETLGAQKEQMIEEESIEGLDF